MPHLLRSFPKAILHIDGDSFFASCEVAVNPKLRGKFVVTGRERGIASSMTYNLKAMGVTRGMSLKEIRKICPSVIIVPSDYETYSLYSKRMYAIVRRYTEAVEEYSIDECFADLTGMRRPLRMSYEEIAEHIKHDLETELGITFSIGLAPNKVLAKVASKWKKPAGLTIIPGRQIENYLRDLPVEKLWGIGAQTGALLRSHGVHTALQFAGKPQEWVQAHLSKPYRELWAELRGEFIYLLTTGEKHEYQSISKTKTFSPASSDRSLVFSQLSKNVENACIKARRHGLAPKKVFFFLKTQGFDYSGLELSLSAPLPHPHEILKFIAEHFDSVYRSRILYRATGVVLADLNGGEALQLDLFGSVATLERWKPVYAAIDGLDRRFGKHTIYLGSSFRAHNEREHMDERGDAPSRTEKLLKGENKRQRVGIPLLGSAR